MFFLLTLLGCATASVAKYPNVSYPPTNPESVAVYHNFPPAKHQVIGEVSYRGAPAARWSGADKLLKQEAAKIGGDAIVIQEKETPIRGAAINSGYVGLLREKEMRGVIIKFTE